MATANDATHTVEFGRAKARHRKTARKVGLSALAITMSACVLALTVLITRTMDGRDITPRVIIYTLLATILVSVLGGFILLWKLLDRKVETVFDAAVLETNADRADRTVQLKAAINELSRQVGTLRNELHTTTQRLPEAIRQYGDERATESWVDAYRLAEEEHANTRGVGHANLSVVRQRR
jgi:hypothetical protein